MTASPPADAAANRPLALVLEKAYQRKGVGHGSEVGEELPGGRFPGKVLGVAAAGGARQGEGALHRLGQIPVQGADLALAHHVLGSRHRKGGDRQAAGERLQHHQAEGVGEAGEDEHVGGGDMARQVGAELGAEEVDVGIARLQGRALRAVADHHLGAGQRQRQERADVLFHRHPPDIEMDRPRQVEQRGLVRPEQLQVDPAGPAADVGEAARDQLVLDRLGRDHDPRRRRVKAPHDAVGPGQRNGEAGRDVFRKLGVIGGGEGQAPLQAPGARGAAERPFGRDVNGIGLQRVELPAQLPPRQQRQANLRIGRAGNGTELIGRDDVDPVAQPLQLGLGALQGAHHAVHLRGPGVGDKGEVQGLVSARGSEGEVGRQHGELPLGRPLDDLEPAVAMLDQGGAALHPVAIVAVEDAVDDLDLGLVDVAAHHAVEAAALGFLRHRMLEVADELDRVLDPRLQERRQRPVRIAERDARAVVPVIDLQAPGIGMVAQLRQPARVLDDAVERIAVRHQQPLAVGGDVDGLVHHLHVAERHAVVVAQRLVVVARDIDDARALARLAQQLLHHVVVALRPEPGALQAPAIDDVADQVDLVGVVVLQEIEQEFGLAAARPQMNIGNENGAVVVDRRRRLHLSCFPTVAPARESPLRAA